MFEKVAALPSDENLLQLMLGGDASAFEALYDRRQGGIYRYALRMTGSQSIAEDVTQDVFLSLMRDHSDYQPSRGTVKSYLYGMARHRLLRRLDRERAFVSLVASDSTTDEPASARLCCSNQDPFADLAKGEVIELVRQAVLSLPAHFREVVVLCYLQEMNYADAAEIINCPIGTVRSRLARARSLLVGKLGMFRTDDDAITEIKAERAI
jgi:RNA polymerase sigma-70 factor, ECF subfamily